LVEICLALAVAAVSLRNAVSAKGHIPQVSKEIEITINNNGGIQVSRSNHEDNEALMKFLLQTLEEELHDEVKKFFEEENDVELLYGSTSFCG